MVKLDIRAFKIRELRREASAAWSYACTKDADSMAGDMAERAAIEFEEEAAMMESNPNYRTKF